MKTKRKLTLGALLVVFVGIISGVSSTSKYVAPEPITTEEVSATSTVTVERDVVEEAQKELERINAELDAEETKLLEELEILENRLEQIRETRVSF